MPGRTSKPTKSSGLSPALERLTISPGLSPIPKPIGTLIVKSGSVWVLVALNSMLLGNNKLSAVLPKKEPFTSKRAFSPKIMPLGLIKNKSALPKTPKVPNISEGLVPVTLPKIFSNPLGLAK